MKRFKYRHKHDNRSFILITITIIVVSLTVGYSLFAETLHLSGSAQNPKYVSPRLIPQFTLNGGLYVTKTLGQNLTYVSESYDGKNNITINFRRKNTQSTLRTTTLNINTWRNIYPLSLTAGTASYTIVSGSGNFGTVTPTVGVTTVNANGTTYFRVVLSMRTSVAGAIQVLCTYRYTYDGVYKYFYFTINVAA